MHQQELMTMMIVFPTFAGGIIWLIQKIMDWRKFKRLLEFNTKLIDRFSNPEDLKAFLETGSGDQIFKLINVEEQSHTTRQKLMSSMTKAIVLVCLGIGFFIIAEFKMFGPEVQGLGAFGIIAMALGIGFLISTALSFKLSQKWGIIDGE